MKYYLIPFIILWAMLIACVIMPILDITYIKKGEQYRPRHMGNISRSDIVILDTQMFTYQYYYMDRISKYDDSIYGDTKLGSRLYYKKVKK